MLRELLPLAAKQLSHPTSCTCQNWSKSQLSLSRLLQEAQFGTRNLPPLYYHVALSLLLPAKHTVSILQAAHLELPRSVAELETNCMSTQTENGLKMGDIGVLSSEQ